MSDAALAAFLAGGRPRFFFFLPSFSSVSSYSVLRVFSSSSSAPTSDSCLMSNSSGWRWMSKMWFFNVGSSGLISLQTGHPNPVSSCAEQISLWHTSLVNPMIDSLQRLHFHSICSMSIWSFSSLTRSSLSFDYKLLKYIINSQSIHRFIYSPQNHSNKYPNVTSFCFFLFFILDIDLPSFSTFSVSSILVLGLQKRFSGNDAFLGVKFP